MPLLCAGMSMLDTLKTLLQKGLYLGLVRWVLEQVIIDSLPLLLSPSHLAHVQARGFERLPQPIGRLLYDRIPAGIRIEGDYRLPQLRHLRLQSLPKIFLKAMHAGDRNHSIPA